MCASREELLATVERAVLSGEVEPLTDLTMTGDDLLRLQTLHATPSGENREALNRQMRADVVTAIRQFRDAAKPSRVVRVEQGEFREHAPIENIAPAADQVRDAEIIFDTSAGEKTLTIGVLVRVDQCWKILYV